MRRRHRTITASVEVDIEEFSDDDLKAAFEERGLPMGGIAEAERLYDAVCEGRIEDAKLILERQLRPRWRDLQSCTDAFNATRANQ